MARPKSPWGNAHARLKRLYSERIEPVMSQKEFARLHGFGSQAVVAQYLTGAIPLNYDAAAKFARALGCTISDICPEMANTLAHEIFPVLGKALRRAATFILVVLAPGFAPSDAMACTSHNTSASDKGAKDLTKSNTYYTFWVLLLHAAKLFKSVQTRIVGSMSEVARTLHGWERYHGPCCLHP